MNYIKNLFNTYKPGLTVGLAWGFMMVFAYEFVKFAL